MVAGMAVALTAAVVTGLGGTTDSGGEYWKRSTATFAPPGTSAPVAVTYDRTLVPEGSSIEVQQRTGAGGATTVRLRVTGLRAGHTYGAHVHQKPCGTDPESSGGHYQHQPPDAAADNEVWLDFTADDRGAGEATVRHDWEFRPGEASSLVLHDRPGDSGARVGCLTVPFGRTGQDAGPFGRTGQDTVPMGWAGPAAAAYGSVGQGVVPYGWAGEGLVPYGWAGPAAGSFWWSR
ncbi:superoxide dismutase family protein [Streptomyces poonensis]|uniref:Superoxide dismutase n=1 Tax=Streptomyces poonensis TaxID=68255 RepID=A0A918UHY9_9ACTN|nr:superoxide dismutase family protein [Streptomyces poonensis]GGZ11293.1 hypothetical protein GCM10010365_33520 [Streptomyces poonensis]GLJ91590.1 hypothetical protein GCM10017589_41970 [Streptomyces poonensis]